MFVPHEINAYLRLQASEIDFAKIKSVSIRECKLGNYYFELRSFLRRYRGSPGPVPLMRCIVRDLAATDANVDPTRGLAGRTCTHIRTHAYARTPPEVYGREHGREEKKKPGERTLVCLYDVIEFMCGTSISEALPAAQHRAPRLL